MKKLISVLLAMFLLISCAVTAVAAESNAEFIYKLSLTDENGNAINDVTALKAGDKINVAIDVTRTDLTEDSYQAYVVEFKVTSTGLSYNNDGISFREGTRVGADVYFDCVVTGFTYMDLSLAGETVTNPLRVASWSYTVDDPTNVSIEVTTAIVCVTGEEGSVPVELVTLSLNPNEGQIIGEDISGEYPVGEKVILPDAQREDYIFLGWSDGIDLYPAGSEYVLSGYVTLVAQWEELPRDLHLTLDPNGGQIVGEDVSGDYASGEVVILPDAQREGYVFLGWNDGVATYGANEEYTVTAAVTLVAQWEPVPTDPVDPTDPTEPTTPTQPTDPTDPTNPIEPTDPTEPTTPTDPTEPVKPTPNSGVYLAAGAGTGILGLLLLLLLLWKRSLVQYSLVTGDVSLYYKNGEVPAEVSVVLYDGEKEYHLNKSGRVEVKHRLRFIKNTTNIAVADIKPGTYQGKFLIHEGNDVRVKKCRIKVIDRELDKKPGN